MADNTTLADMIGDAKLHHATRAKADKLDGILRAEYPALLLKPDLNEDSSRVTGWNVETHEGESIYAGDKVPDLSTLLDECEDRGIDPEEGAEEPKTSGSVVPEHYRKQYRESSSNGQSCGDWLAEQLLLDTHGPDGFSTPDFEQVLSNNGVDLTAKWAQLPYTGSKGWQGRYRMNGRQVMEKNVALNGVYVDVHGNTLNPDPAWLKAMEEKHAKWLAKQRKIAAALEE